MNKDKPNRSTETKPTAGADWIERMNNDLRAEDAKRREKNNERMRELHRREEEKKAKIRRGLAIAGASVAAAAIIFGIAFGISRCAGGDKPETAAGGSSHTDFEDYGGYTGNTEAEKNEEPTRAPEKEPDELSLNDGGSGGTNGGTSGGTIIVLDPGHGKSSGAMSADEKLQMGYVQNSDGNWGEWRHWKNGTANADCQGSGCHGDKECWYPISSGDRSTEPDINLRNAQAAKKYLEQMGYTVRMTRDASSSSSTENPSFSRRVSFCYPNNDLNAAPDAACYICLHSNAGGGRGSAYIAASGGYTQKWIQSDYAEQCGRLGSMINSRITSETSLGTHGGGSIGGEGYLILFNKSPVPAGYMEIGFFDSSSDLAILNSEYDAIGKAIAEGVDDYIKSR